MGRSGDAYEAQRLNDEMSGRFDDYEPPKAPSSINGPDASWLMSAANRVAARTWSADAGKAANDLANWLQKQGAMSGNRYIMLTRDGERLLRQFLPYAFRSVLALPADDRRRVERIARQADVEIDAQQPEDRAAESVVTTVNAVRKWWSGS